MHLSNAIQTWATCGLGQQSHWNTRALFLALLCQCLTLGKFVFILQHSFGKRLEGERILILKLLFITCKSLWHPWNKSNNIRTEYDLALAIKWTTTEMPLPAFCLMGPGKVAMDSCDLANRLGRKETASYKRETKILVSMATSHNIACLSFIPFYFSSRQL